MFGRVKKIKGKPYLYIVENKWRKGKVRQVVKKYLGRVFELEKMNNKDFFGFFSINKINDYLKAKSRAEIMKDLITLELFNHGFREKSKNKLKWGKITVDLGNRKIKIKKRNAVLKLNEGYLYEDIMKRLLEFSPKKNKEKSGMELAQDFADSGISVPQEIFVGLVMGKSFNIDELNRLHTNETDK